MMYYDKNALADQKFTFCAVAVLNHNPDRKQTHPLHASFATLNQRLRWHRCFNALPFCECKLRSVTIPPLFAVKHAAIIKLYKFSARCANENDRRSRQRAFNDHCVWEALQRGPRVS